MQISSRTMTHSRTLLQRFLNVVHFTRSVESVLGCKTLSCTSGALNYMANVIARAIQHSSEFDAIVATSAQFYTMPVPCQHNVFRVTLSLPPCRLTTLQMCQACKNSLSLGQQDDRCKLICPSYAQLDLQMCRSVAHWQVVFQQRHLGQP